MKQKKIDPAILSSLVPIKALSPDHCKELAAKSKLGEMNAGSFLYKSGDRVTKVIYVLKGEVEMLQKGTVTTVVCGGTQQAKLPLEKKSCSARAKTNVLYLSVDADLLDNMLALEQSGRIEVQSLESDEDWMSVILQASIFHKIPPLNIQSVFLRMSEVKLRAGAYVVKQGEEGDSFFIVRGGSCEVVRQTKSAPDGLVLAKLKKGDFFGEESLISEAKRNASVVMKTDGIVMRLTKKDFLELLKEPVLKSIDYSEIQADPGIVWLDVRLPNEYRDRHLKNSLNLPLPLLRSKQAKLDRNRRYVVYCDTQKRSSTATFLLNQWDIDALVLAGGLGSVPQEGLASVA